MSTSPANPGQPRVIPGLDSSDRPVPAYIGDTRYPLGLPAGSVRALLAFSVLGLLWALVLTYRNQALPLPEIYNYLQYLMVLILAHFFAAHGNSIGGAARKWSPLFLPRGSVRLLLTAGVVGLIVWLIYNWDDYPTLPAFPKALPVVLLGGFLAGYVFHRSVQQLSGGRIPFWFQDVEAWIALISVLALGGELVFHVLIRPSLEDQSAWDFKRWDVANPILAAIISFYFGARS